MLVKIYWNVLFENDNDIVNGFDLVEIEKNEYINIYNIADNWLDDCINEKIARAEYYPPNKIKLANFFNTINISSGIIDFKITNISTKSNTKTNLNKTIP